jgi:solute carrier organic anion transporter family, member 5A
MFILIGTLFDTAVWYCVKDLKIFDEEIKDKELELVQKEDEGEVEKHT